ncbi:hypothetical protein P7K49_029523, partial [Saguinus oedipus]
LSTPIDSASKRSNISALPSFPLDIKTVPANLSRAWAWLSVTGGGKTTENGGYAGGAPPAQVSKSAGSTIISCGEPLLEGTAVPLGEREYFLMQSQCISSSGHAGDIIDAYVMCLFISSCVVLKKSKVALESASEVVREARSSPSVDSWETAATGPDGNSDTGCPSKRVVCASLLNLPFCVERAVGGHQRVEQPSLEQKGLR